MMFRHRSLLILIFLIPAFIIQFNWFRAIKKDKGVFDDLSYIYQATTTAAQTAMLEISTTNSVKGSLVSQESSPRIRIKPQDNSNLLINQKKRNNTRRPKVLYTVFAGRKNRLLLQEPYWLEMYELGVIDEIHIWNYTRDRVNGDYIRHLASKYATFLSVKQPTGVTMEETLDFDKNNTFRSGLMNYYGKGRASFWWPAQRGYSEYYKYYTENPYDGVIIKADDDTVFVNSTMIPSFARYIWQHKEIFLLSASVVNQGLCAYYQQKHDAIPKSYETFPYARNGMGNLQTNGTQAFRLHSYFLASEENRARFYIKEPEYYRFNFTININFVAIRGEDMHVAWEMILKKLVVEKRYYDEGAITWDAIRWGRKQMGIYMPMVVAHATYSHQLKMERKILSLWTEWARKERADFYRGIL